MARGPVAMVEAPRGGDGFAWHAVKMVLVLAPLLLMASKAANGGMPAPRMPREVLAMVVTMEIFAWQQWLVVELLAQHL